MTITPAYPNDRLNGINVNQPGTIRRCNISGTVDGVMIYGNGVTIEDSYLHDFATPPTTTQGPTAKTHNDGVQIQAGSGIVIRRNNIKGASNSAIIITQDAGTVGDPPLTTTTSTAGRPSTSSPMACRYPISRCGVTTSAGISDSLARQSARASHCVPDITGSVWADTGEPSKFPKARPHPTRHGGFLHVGGTMSERCERLPRTPGVHRRIRRRWPGDPVPDRD